MKKGYIEWNGKMYKLYCDCNSSWDTDYDNRDKEPIYEHSGFGCVNCGMNFWIKLNDPVITNESIVLEEEKLGDRRIRLRR